MSARTGKRGTFAAYRERRAAARLVARLVARDGHIDWREVEFLDASGAFAMLGVSRGQFMEILAQAVGERLGTGAAGTVRLPAEGELARVRERSLQLLVAALLVYISEIDREVEPQESELVRKVFRRWAITPEILEQELRVPAVRSLTALRAA